MRRSRNLAARCSLLAGLVAMSGAAPAAAGESGVPPAGIAAQAEAAAPDATFTREVLPILQRSCQRCHRPGTGAPMSLLTYEEARPWARAIRDRVVTRQMPPWHIDRSIGEYTADPSLSDIEIATIAAWVDGGAPRGNPADAPPPLDLANLNEWTYGEPDLVVQMKEGFPHPGRGSRLLPLRDRRPRPHRGPLRQVGADHPRGLLLRAPFARLRERAGDHRGSRGVPPRNGIQHRGRSTSSSTPWGARGSTTRRAPAASCPPAACSASRRTTHPWGEETIDRQKVGVKFYPQGRGAGAHRHRAPHPHRHRPRLEAEPRGGGGPAAAGRLRPRPPRRPHAGRRPDRRQHAERRRAAEHPAAQRRPPRALLAAAAGRARPQLPAPHALPGQAHAARGQSTSTAAARC